MFLGLCNTYSLLAFFPVPPNLRISKHILHLPQFCLLQPPQSQELKLDACVLASSVCEEGCMQHGVCDITSVCVSSYIGY